MAGPNDDITQGTYVNPDSTSWGGKAPDAPIDHYQGPMGVDQYGIPTPTGGRDAWLAAQRAARETSGQAIDVARYRGMGEAAMSRDAPQLNYGYANNALGWSQRNLESSNNTLGEAAQSRAYALQSRADQLDALSLQRNAAYGNAPSQAQALGRNLIDQSLQAQLAGAASARGGGMAQAAAMRQAAQGAASMQQQGTNSLAALRAQEMAQARDSYQQGAYGIRAQDYVGSQMATASAGQYQQNAGQYTQNAAQYAQMEQQRALLEMQQRQLNDSNQQFYEQLGWNTNNAQLQAGLGQQSVAMQGDMNRQNVAMQQQAANQQFWAAMAGAGATVGAGVLTRRASGGPVDGGKPVLVGEKGPEIIVPQGKGNVLPAHHPASITMAQASSLRRQADALEASMRNQLAAGPSASVPRNRSISMPPVVIDDAPEPSASMGRVAMMPGQNYSAMPSPGQDMSPRSAGPDMSTPPPERLWGGREDPYTADPYYVPLDHAPPTWGANLSGGRDDPYEYGGAREEGGPVDQDKAYLVGEKGPEVIVQPKYAYDASKPFGERFVPNPAYVPVAVPQPEEKPKPVYVYDATRPFGERFVPAAPRQMTFERNNDAEMARVAKEHEAAANENMKNATVLTLLQGPGVAAPAAGSGVAHWIQSLLARGGSK